jgi:hypothetical protein
MRKIPIAIVTLIFSTFVFASCDTNSSSQDVIHVTSAAAWTNALASISTAPGGSPGNPAVFVIDIAGSFSVPGIGEDGSSITGNYKEVRLTGNGKMSLSGTGSLILVSANQTFIIDGPTLQGTSGNNMPLVFTAGGLELRSGYITGNKNDDVCGGVGVDTGGTFTMSGGEISGNNSVGAGGGVFIAGGTFTMSGGAVSENNADYGGGGVFIWDSTFTMTGGAISDNTSAGNGGGVYLDYVSFDMKAGTISGNTASHGGGVFNNNDATFTMTGGVIYGSGAADSLKNTATSSGAAVYNSSGPTDNDISTYKYPPSP